MIASYKENYELDNLPGCVKQTLWKDWALFILLNPNLILIISCPQVELLMIVWRICGHCDAWDVAVIVVEERSGDKNCRNNKHLDFYQCKFWCRFCNRYSWSKPSEEFLNGKKTILRSSLINLSATAAHAQKQTMSQFCMIFAEQFKSQQLQWQRNSW